MHIFLTKKETKEQENKNKKELFLANVAKYYANIEFKVYIILTIFFFLSEKLNHHSLYLKRE